MTARLLALLLLPLLLCGAMPAVADPSTPAPTARSTQDSADLEQTVRPDEKRADGTAVVLSRGHVDIGPKMVNGAWRLQVRDDTATPPVWRNLDEVVLKVSDQALLTVPQRPEYAFLGVPAGQRVHVVPQTQHQQVIWIGWNTQDPAAVQAMGRGATMSLLRWHGPGSFHLFLQNGQTGGPQQLWDGGQKKQQDVWVDVNTHTHANWVFGAPGTYLAEVRMSATAPDGQALTDTAILRLSVGDGTPVQAAAAATLAGPAPAATSPGSATAAPVGRKDDPGLGGAVLWIGAAAIALIALVAAVLLRSRRARAAAEREVAR